jgi:hypothetical protein
VTSTIVKPIIGDTDEAARQAAAALYATCDPQKLHFQSE